MNKLEYIPGDIVKIEYGKATGKIGFVTITFLRRKGCYSLVVFIGKGFQGSSKDDWIQTYNDEVSPIPLTTEILEKNGWERKVMSRGIKNSHLVYIRKFSILLITQEIGLLKIGENFILKKLRRISNDYNNTNVATICRRRHCSNRIIILFVCWNNFSVGFL